RCAWLSPLSLPDALPILGADFFLLGEVWGGDGEVLDPWFEPDEIDAGFDFGFSGSVIAFLQGRGRTVAFNRYLEKRGKVRPKHLDRKSTRLNSSHVASSY